MHSYLKHFGKFARKRCPHSWLEGIYGDEINKCGGWRLWCHQCLRFIDGPVSLAGSRRSEYGRKNEDD